jgi:hypothetical protein
VGEKRIFVEIQKKISRFACGETALKEEYSSPSLLYDPHFCLSGKTSDSVHKEHNPRSAMSVSGQARNNFRHSL